MPIQPNSLDMELMVLLNNLFNNNKGSNNLNINSNRGILNSKYNSNINNLKCMEINTKWE